MPIKFKLLLAKNKDGIFHVDQIIFPRPRLKSFKILLIPKRGKVSSLKIQISDLSHRAREHGIHRTGGTRRTRRGTNTLERRIWPENKGLRDLMSDRERKETNDPRGISWGENANLCKISESFAGLRRGFRGGSTKMLTYWKSSHDATERKI